MKPLAGPVLTAAQMRAAEASCGVALSELMERAGAALAESVWRFGGGQGALILCGPGNNGGDGYVAARLLAERGVAVRVAASHAPGTDLARAAAAGWRGDVETLDAEPAALLVDCLFGTGLTRSLSHELRNALHRLAGNARFTIAADLPSGVATDDGADLGAARADLTLAFAAAKPAHLLMPAADRCGHVLLADIGIRPDSKANVLCAPAFTPPGPADNKYSRGLVLVIGGAMPGASALAAAAAARGGAGYVVLAGEGGTIPNAVVRRPRADLAGLLGDGRTGAVLIGPGFGDDDRALEVAIDSPHPLVLDGGALRAGLPRRAAPTILTPHGGEFARMFGDAGGGKVERASAAAERSRATIIFKGADTVIASPGGRVTLCPAGSAWLATAGTGDVLAGLAAAMLAHGLPPHEAACAAVWRHNEAARRAGARLIADDLLLHLKP